MYHTAPSYKCQSSAPFCLGFHKVLAWLSLEDMQIAEACTWYQEVNLWWEISSSFFDIVDLKALYKFQSNLNVTTLRTSSTNFKKVFSWWQNYNCWSLFSDRYLGTIWIDNDACGLGMSGLSSAFSSNSIGSPFGGWRSMQSEASRDQPIIGLSKSDKNLVGWVVVDKDEENWRPKMTKCSSKLVNDWPQVVVEQPLEGRRRKPLSLLYFGDTYFKEGKKFFQRTLYTSSRWLLMPPKKPICEKIWVEQTLWQIPN